MPFAATSPDKLQTGASAKRSRQNAAGATIAEAWWTGRHERGQDSMKLKSLLSLNVLALSLCIAQGYYPLEVGNRWDYGYLDFIPGGPAGQFVYQRTVRVLGDSIMPNGKLYAALSDHNFLRQQGDTVFSYSQSQGDYVVYDFSRHDGDTIKQFTAHDTLTTTVHRGNGTVFGFSRTIWAFHTESSRSSYYSFINIADSFGYTYGQWEPGENEYCLGAIINGIQYGTITAVAQSKKSVPTWVSLSENYPNPFNPTTTNQFTLPSQSYVTLKIFDLLGREVFLLLSRQLPAGTHSRRWNGTGFTSGAYFYRLQAGSFVETKKLNLLK